jgi:two-component system cell cycle sensor histidine kinase/response regulator CckA
LAFFVQEFPAAADRPGMAAPLLEIDLTSRLAWALLGVGVVGLALDAHALADAPGSWMAIGAGLVSIVAALGAAAMLVVIRRQARALDAFMAEERQYRQIFEDAVGGIFRTTPEGRFLKANPAMARISGYASAAELIAERTDIGRQGYLRPELRDEFKRLIDTLGYVEGFEYEVLRKDGSTFWVSETARAIRDTDGRILCYEGILEDIDARKRAEVATREGDRRAIDGYERLLDRLAVLAQDLATASDLNGVFRALRGFVEMSAPCSGMFVSLYDAARQQRRGVYAASEGREEEVAQLPLMPMTDSPHSRAIREARIVVTDDLQSALNKMPRSDLGFDIDPRLPQSSIVVPMTVMRRVIGAMEIQSVGPAAYKTEHVTALRMAAALAGIATENVRLLDDERRLRREAEESVGKLRQSEAFLDIVGRTARIGGWQADLSESRVVWSDEVCRIRGVAPGTSLTIEQAIAFYAPEYREKVREEFRACVREGRTVDEELEIITASGERVWVRLIGHPVRNALGAVVRMQGALQDITARKEAEEAMRQVGTRLTTTLESITDAFFTLDPQWRLTYLNGQTERALQRPRQELLGKVLWSAFPDLRGTKFEHESHRAVAQHCTVEYEEFYAPLGLWLEVRAYPSEGGLAVYFRDITERRRAEQERALLEAQLREAQKMEAIGLLAGGVAHDFNNILGAILGNAELARPEMAGAPAALASLEEIRKAGHRGRDLVAQILAFSRKQPVARRPVSLTAIAEESVRLLRTTLPPRVNVACEFAPDVPAILADVTQMGQVITNLAANAADAMDGMPGLIGIRIEPVVADGSRFHPRDLAPGTYARVTVRDTGHGMDSRTLERIFEPFFTTKPVGEGTGLGLPVVHGIVRDHGGVIAVHSAPGKGTRFDLYFPATTEQAVEEPAPAEPPGAARRGRGEHILYLDDDEAQVFLVTRMLERRGYRVSGFLNQREALDALKRDPAAFSLLVTDYSMPGMSGLDVARAAREIRADLPVAIATGYVTAQLQAQASDAGVRDVIFKANVVQEFIDVVQRLVPSPAASPV